MLVYKTFLKQLEMVSVQPINGPCGIVFSIDGSLNKHNKISRQAVAAESFLYNITLFPKANFDIIKDIYADALADNLDIIIANHLPKIDVNLLPENVDYIIAAKSVIETLKSKQSYKDVDFYEMPQICGSINTAPRAGKYPRFECGFVKMTCISNLETRIFSPYILLGVTPNNALQLRAGWSKERKINE